MSFRPYGWHETFIAPGVGTIIQGIAPGRIIDVRFDDGDVTIIVVKCLEDGIFDILDDRTIFFLGDPASLDKIRTHLEGVISDHFMNQPIYDRIIQK
jgi:hypothetical protein